MVDATASTNADVAARAAQGAKAGLVLVAEHQTAGRGRLDRVWETPARSALTFSALLRPSVPVEQWTWLPLLTGLAVVGALRDMKVAGVTLKWPNDILLATGLGAAESLKVGGILVERAGGADSAAVVGIGLNVTTTRAELPVATAGSLLDSGAVLDRAELLVAVLTHLAELYDDFEDRSAGRSSDRFRDAYRQVCSTVGRQVSVHLPGDQTLVAEAVDIDLQGRLVVEADGERHSIGAGDVVHVRPH